MKLAVKLRSQFCKSWLLMLVVLNIVDECLQLMGLVGNRLALRRLWMCAYVCAIIGNGRDNAMYKGQLEVCNGVACIEDGWAAIRSHGDS